MNEQQVAAALEHAAELMTAALAGEHALVADLLAGMDGDDLESAVHGLLALSAGMWQTIAAGHERDPRALWAYWLTTEYADG